MGTHQFEYGDVKVELLEPSETTLFNKARYLIRLAVSRFAFQKMSRARVLYAPEFATILAHIDSAEGLPFDAPSPRSHPDAVGTAWDIFLDYDPDLWKRLVKAIGLPDPERFVERQFIANMDRALAELESQMRYGGFE
jgi:hypothetical protein